jgi:hypothetical protein
MISVYETLSGPSAHSIVSIPIDSINERFHELENILSPKSLSKNCKITYDKKLKLANGLGSSIRIRSGFYLLSDYAYRIIINRQDCTDHIRKSIPQFSAVDDQLNLLKTAFELRVSGGIAERGIDGRITAHVEFAGATIHSHQGMAIMGITEATFATADKFLSLDPDSPTIFESSKDFTISSGTVIPKFFGGLITTEGDLEGNMFIKTTMYYKDGVIRGNYIALSDQNILFPGAPPLLVEADFAGTFELKLDIH